MTGASQATGLGSAEAPEPHSGLRPAGAIPRAAFTPGPWLVHATNRLVCQAEGAFKKVRVENGKVLGDDLPNNICLLRDPGDDFSEDETLANGFLIAAAPELYEALERLDSAISVERSGDIELEGWMDAVDELDAAREQTRAALAKARGEQP